MMSLTASFRDDIHPGGDLAKHGKVAIELRLRRERDVHLAVAKAGIAGVRRCHRADDVLPLHFRDADVPAAAS